MNAGFCLLDHPADVGFRAWGPTFDEALSQAVGALASIVAGERLAPTVETPCLVEAASPEETVVALLEEVLYLLDARGLLCVAARPGHLLGLPVDLDALSGTVVKAITWHGLEVTQGPEGTQITVYVDI